MNMKPKNLNKCQILVTLVHFCNDWHSGQWSKGYRYLCLSMKSLQNMGVYYPIDIELNNKQKKLYAYLVDNYSDKM